MPQGAIERLNETLGGRFRVESQLGEGGMGAVYLAEQLEPVRREVAVKVLPSGADSEQVVARFEAERQALALMDHPGIARIFDAGVTTDGRPYFVMERVAGPPIHEYCDEHRLSIRDRVGLFADVCAAVQHAHQKGVIHRDLKPSNVLVSEVDGRALPKVIDFGLAKDTAPGHFDGTQLTRHDQIVGTPAYMSPEQIDGSRDIDTRTDVYALGIMLYQLLVGELPYDDAAYRGWAAIAARMTGDLPELTERFRELPETQVTVAELRGTSPSTLRKQLSGDLGWIVTRATHRDREHRYETANALGLDLERHLKDEPLRAPGATTTDAFRKFVRRNRVGVSFGSVIAVALVAFSITTSVQSRRTARARDEAEARRSQAEALIDFMLTDLRDRLEPIGRLEILDGVGEQALAYFASLPEEAFGDEELLSRSQALYQIGNVRLEQGDSEAAGEAFAESLRLARALSARAPDDADRLFELSQAHFYVGYASWLEGDLDAAEAQFSEYLAAARRMLELQPDNPDYRIELGFALSNLGSVREARGDLAGAEEAFLGTVETGEALVTLDSTNIDWIGELAETHNLLGTVYRKQGRLGDALASHERELDLKRRALALDPTHAYWRYRTAVAHGFAGGVLLVMGRPREALGLAEEERELLSGLVEQDPANTRWRNSLALANRSVGQALIRLEDYPGALAALGDARNELERLLESDSTGFGWNLDLASVETDRAYALLSAARSYDALAAAERGTRLLGADAAQTANGAVTVARNFAVLGRALQAAGRPTEAREAWRTGLDTVERYETAIDRMQFRPVAAELLLLLGRLDDARNELAALAEAGYVDEALTKLATVSGLDR